jgi:hypothetical protein
MRRRPPHMIALTETDRSALQELVHDGRIQQRIARRARVLLAMEDDTTVVQELAHQVAMTRSGIWRLCRRYEEEGLAVVEAAPQPGRPRQFSPLGAGANRATGVL